MSKASALNTMISFFHRAIRSFFTWRTRPSDVVRDLAAVSIFGSLVGFAGRWHWIPDLFSHFQLQYLEILGAAAAILFVVRRPRPASVCAVCALINVAQIAPLYRARSTPAPPPAKSVRVMEINVLRENHHTDQGVREIREAHPDVVLVMEVTPAWMDKLEALRDLCPYVIAEPQDDCFGIALFSKWPIRDPQILWLGLGWVPTLVATVDVDGSPLQVIGTHAIPPVSGGRWDARNAQFVDVARLAANRRDPLVVLGDFNCTPWSPWFRALLRDGRLVNSARGFGVQPGWIAFGPAPLRIPIDHVLVSPEIHVADRRIGTPFGSDHLPVIADLAW